MIAPPRAFEDVRVGGGRWTIAAARAGAWRAEAERLAATVVEEAGAHAQAASRFVGRILTA